MKVKGSNITTLNNSDLTKDLQVEHNGAHVELITTKRGIALYGFKTKFYKNGNTIMALSDDVKPYDFEELIDAQMVVPK